MSQTEAKELLAAVSAFLREDILPQLEGFNAYTTRVAANSLAIVAREIEHRPELERLEFAAAAALGLDPVAGPVNRQIALGLKSGEIALDARLLDYLKQHTLKSLEIDNPKYSGYLQARQRWQVSPGGEE